MNDILTKCTRAAGILAVSAAMISSASAQSPTPISIVFGAPPTTFELPHFVADELGWFEKAGLTADEVFVAGDSNAIRGLISGDALGGATALMVAMQAISEGAKIKIIGSWQPRVDYQILAHTSLKNYQDLSGQSIATGSVGGLTQRIPEMIMEKHGINKSSATFISIGGHQARMKAVVAGKVQAAAVGMLYAAQGVAAAPDEVHIIGSVAKEFPGLGFTFLVVKEEDLADPARRLAIEKYVRLAIVDGARFIKANPEKAAEIMHKKTPDTPLDLIKSAISQMNDLDLWGVNGGLDPDVIEFTARLGREMGVLKQGANLEQAVDSSIVDKVLAEAGRQ